MSNALLCASPIEGLVLRITKLNACGVPITGTGGVATPVSGSGSLVMDGFTEVTPSPQYDTGDRVITRKANGAICQNFKIPDQFTNYEQTINFCTWNPALIPITIAGRLLTATSSPTGTGFAHGTWSNALINSARWSLEIWQAPPQACDSSGVVYYPYFAWPHLGDAKLGDFNINLDSNILQIMANSYDASPLWTVGNSYLGTGQVVFGDHMLYNLTSTVPPPSACFLSDYP
jgi:hypothetical protein